MYAKNYGVEIVGSLDRPDGVILDEFSLMRLQRFAAYGGIMSGNLGYQPQRICCDGRFYYFLNRSAYELMAYALPHPENLYRSSESRASYCYSEYYRSLIDYDAYGTLMSDGTFLVHAGATMRQYPARSLDLHAQRLRKELVDGGVIDAGSKFTRFFLFDSAATAARVITGYNRGTGFWISQTGTRLKA